MLGDAVLEVWFQDEMVSTQHKKFIFIYNTICKTKFEINFSIFSCKLTLRHDTIILQCLIDVILGDLLQSVFSVVSAPDNIVQSKLVSLTK